MNHNGSDSNTIIAYGFIHSNSANKRRIPDSLKNEKLYIPHPIRILNPFTSAYRSTYNTQTKNSDLFLTKKNKQGCTMSNRIFPSNVFFTAVLTIVLLIFISPAKTTTVFAQEVLNSVQMDQMTLSAELKNDGSLWVRDFKNERGDVTSLTVFDIKEDILKEVTRKATKEEVANSDAVAKFNCYGKPVVVCKFGVIAIRRLSMETIVDHVVWPVEITAVNLTGYPGKEGWGILEINGKKELVVYHQRGSETLLRPYKAGKDPS